MPAFPLLWYFHGSLQRQNNRGRKQTWSCQGLRVRRGAGYKVAWGDSGSAEGSRPWIRSRLGWWFHYCTHSSKSTRIYSEDELCPINCALTFKLPEMDSVPKPAAPTPRWRIPSQPLLKAHRCFSCPHSWVRRSACRRHLSVASSRVLPQHSCPGNLANGGPGGLQSTGSSRTRHIRSD